MRRSLIGAAIVAVTILVSSVGFTVAEEYLSDNPPSSTEELAARLLPNVFGEAEPPYVPDADVYAYSEAIEFTDLGEELFFAARPKIYPAETFQDACSEVNSEPGVGVLGCYYSGTNLIHLYDVTDSRLTPIEPVVAAHEMLHAAWYTLSPETQADLEVQLMEAFFGLPVSHPAVQRLKNYVNSAPESLATELHSILGTEVVELPAGLEAHYAQYFANRPQLAERANEAYGVFTDTQQKALELLSEIQIMDAGLEEIRAQLAAEDASLTEDILAFNAKNDSGGFGSRAEYNRQRDALETRQANLQLTTLAFNEAVNDFNDKVAELEGLNELLKELNQGLNIPERN